MILSFHPCIEADENRLCAGRSPDNEDLSAIRRAEAVILSQGCGRILHAMARANAPHVFPNYDARFRYPGKIGQARLFRETGVRHPATWAYPDTGRFLSSLPHREGLSFPPFPFVFKRDWGGDGEAVFRIDTPPQFAEILQETVALEGGGQRGFLIQEYISCGNRSLRVAVVGKMTFSYWRVADPAVSFKSNLAAGATLDPESDPQLRSVGEERVRSFCRKTGIDLAGFDLLFSEDNQDQEPYFLEINYYFGRTGLGGSESYYKLLTQEVTDWLKIKGLELGRE